MKQKSIAVTKAAERNYRMDNLKCLLIFAVVFGHMLELFMGKNDGFKVIYLVIYSFHMPLFAFISGVFARYSPEKIRNHLIYPYVVFQILYLLFANLVLEKEAEVHQNTMGKIVSRKVVGETAKNLSERLGKILQKRQSVSINRQDTSTSINTQLDFLRPASKISNLAQGKFVGSVADNFGEEIVQKIFHSRIIVDSAKVNAETKAYKKIPIVNEFKDENGNDIMQEQIERNYSRIKDEVEQIVQDEMERIKADPELRKRLLPDEKDEENSD